LPDTYYALKQDFVYIAAEHSQGFEDLLDLIESRIDYKKFANAPLETQSVIRISIVGKPNVGKSSIINAILREDFSIVSPVPGTTRDSVDIEFVRNQQHFILVDNAGIRKLQKLKEDTESAAVIRAEKAIKQADIVIFAVDISKRLDQNDLLIANKVIDSYKPVIIAGNKWDLVENKNSAEKITQFVKNKLNHLYFAPIVHLSALSGKNVMSLIDYSESIFKKLATPIKTVHVNNVIKPVIKQSKLHTQEGKIFNPKYLTIESGNPIFVKFYATHAAKLKPQDERFLKKQICDLLGLEGIPVFFKIVGKSESNTNKS
jgi:GTP-binding protein